MFGYDLGIDLSTSNVVISVPGKGVKLEEPSYVAYEIETERMIYAGRRAYYLEGREPMGVAVIQPLQDGVISSYNMAQQMIKHFISKVIKKNIFKPRVVACVPSLATDVERRTMISVIIGAGARSVCLVEEPLCAAFGAGVEPKQATGAFVINIGGGKTDMAVVSQGAMSQCETVKIAGKAFDEAIVKFIKEKYEIQIGMRSAEHIKKEIGCAVPREENVTIIAKGRGTVDGLPKSAEVSSNDICHCLKPLLNEIVAAAQIMFERTAPQLLADITTSNIILTGGSAQLFGIDQLFQEALGIEVVVAPRPERCVARGTIVALNNMHLLDNYGYRYKTKEDVRIR